MLTRAQWALIVVLGAGPLCLALLLNVARPDLIGPMMSHVFGFIVLAGLLLFSMAAASLVTLSSFWVNRVAPVGSPGRAWRVVVSGLLPFLLCTMPAVFIALFGPIVFAFMFGTVTTSIGGP